MNNMNAFLFIDKPKGITSFYCVKVLRKLCNVRRIGFVGTLDPLATGLMIFALGEATKLIPYLENMDKIYDVTLHLGATSSTYDAQGDLQAYKDPVRPLRSDIEKVIEEEFLGEKDQVPPAFSAIQIEGKRAYDLARRGEKVNLKKRLVHFFEIKIRSSSWPVLRLTVHCSSGTYVRSLAHDLGQKLRCGAYVEELRRTKIGSYKIDKAVELSHLDRNNLVRYFVQPQEMFSDFLQLQLTPKDYLHLSNGGFIKNSSGSTRGPILAMYEGKCVGMLEVHEGKLKFAKKFNIV